MSLARRQLEGLGVKGQSPAMELGGIPPMVEDDTQFLAQTSPLCVVLRLVLSGAEAPRRTSGYGHWLAGVAACAGAMAWDPSLPLVVQDDTERCVVLSTAKDLRLWALARSECGIVRGPWHGILHSRWSFRMTRNAVSS